MLWGIWINLSEGIQDYPLYHHDRKHNIFKPEEEKHNVFRESTPDYSSLGVLKDHN